MTAAITILSSCLIGVAIKILFSRSTLEVIISASVLSITLVCLYLFMDAPDVAMTEAALGACLSTVVLLTIGSRMPKLLTKAVTPYLSLFIGLLSAVAVILMCYKQINNYSSIQKPVHLHYSNKYYTSNLKEDMGIPAFIAGILAGYRSYDTLGESLVILIAGISLILIINPNLGGGESGVNKTHLKNEGNNIDRNKSMLSIICRIIIPYALLICIYIQINGEVSPGGGFQAGSLVGSVFIVYSICSRTISINKKYLVITAIGSVLLYCFIGVSGIIFGGNFLNYGVIPLPHSQHLAIFIIELAIGINVASIITLIYLTFHDIRKR
jgi:multicomponent Na+:H+ antiporter subunit B